MTDLLPCPFCGSTNLRHEFAGSQGFIECNECGTAGPCDERAADPICDFEAAVAAWNRRPTFQPVPVSERLPEPSVKVLAHYFNALGKGRTICAIWVPAKSRSDEGDKYYWPEGWYEAIENWEELGWAKVYEGEIAYWQPLPQWPANALPTPEALAD